MDPRYCLEKGILVIQWILELADFIADWLFFCDVFYLESGLVYGRHKALVVYFILAFALVGTILFLLGTANSFRDFFKGETYFDPTIFNLITLCIEDLPQAGLSLDVAACREDGSSRFQLAKAGISFFLSLVGFICTIYECRKLRKERGDKRKKCIIFVAIFIGLFLNIGASIAVFFLTHTHRQSDGFPTIRAPTSDFEERYDGRYFVNVSVYFFDPSFQSNLSSTPAPDALWIKVAPIDFLRNSTRGSNSLTFQYKYQDTPSHLHMALWDDVGGTLALRECYTLSKENASITAVSNCTQSFLPGAPRGLRVRLLFKPPQFVAHMFRKTIYGDIMFGVKAVNPTGGCHPLSQFQNTLPIDGRHAHPALHYFRSSVGSPSDSHLLRDSGRPRLYKASELVDVASVWKTGWTKCSASGHLAPQLDTGLDVQC